MGIFNQLKEELREKGKLEILNKGRVTILEQAWFKDQEKICPKCNRTQFLTIDHIIPKDILQQFGVDLYSEFIEENLGILCRPCNSFKTNKLDFANPKTKPLLIKFLERV